MLFVCSITCNHPESVNKQIQIQHVIQRERVHNEVLLHASRYIYMRPLWLSQIIEKKFEIFMTYLLKFLKKGIFPPPHTHTHNFWACSCMEPTHFNITAQLYKFTNHKGFCVPLDIHAPKVEYCCSRGKAQRHYFPSKTGLSCWRKHKRGIFKNEDFYFTD